MIAKNFRTNGLNSRASNFQRAQLCKARADKKAKALGLLSMIFIQAWC